MRVLTIFFFVSSLHGVFIHGLCLKFTSEKKKCIYFKTCKNGATCKIHYLNCQTSCICTPGFTGKRCTDVVTTVTVTAPYNVTEPTGNVTDLADNVTEPMSNVTRPIFKTTTTTTTTTTTSDQQQNYTICSRYNIRCYHGNCSTDGGMCECHPGWLGRFCIDVCTLDCGGFPCLPYNDTVYCNCPKHNGTHEYIPLQGCRPVLITTVAPPIYGGIRVRDDHDDYWLPVGIVLGILVLFVITVVIVLAVMWKKRAIFVLKLVYRFKAYVDEEEKEYDAFISYKSSSADYNSSKEELFVIHELLPKLETEFGFKVCVHFRDFVPGLDITDNVLKAIESSHRTIMLISRAYVTESFWTKFEYEQAQVAVINQKQRIIPVLFEDLDDMTISDPTLKLILASTTYLQKPTDTEDDKKMGEFWTRLRLSMPKKRTTSTLQLSHITAEEGKNGVAHHISDIEKSPQQTNHISTIYANNHIKTDKANIMIYNNVDKNNFAGVSGVRYTKYLDC